MSQKQARGTKRTCQSCSSRFYDLNRDPVICPVCQTPFVMTASETAAAADAVRARAAKPVVKEKAFVPAEVLPDGLELPEIESTEALAEIETEGAEIADGEQAEDTFLEEEEGEGDDVATLIDSPVEGEEEV